MKSLLALLFFTLSLFASIPSGAYDAQDHRIAKIVEGTTTTYLVDPNTPYARVIHESRDNGTEIDYSYGLRLLGDGEHTFLTDALGSTRALADGSGQITDSYDYTPYGELLRHSGTSDTPFLFTGEQYDPEAGLYYLRARYYSPELARFLSRDTFEGTLTDPLSQNRYLYARGNPVLYVDPSGHFFTVMEIGASFSIESSLRVANSSKTVRIGLRLMQEAIGFDEKRGIKGFLVDLIQDIAINAVMSTIGNEYSSKSTAGTAAHKKMEEMLREAFPGGGKISWLNYDVYLIPEVFGYVGGGQAYRRAKHSRGVDILIGTLKKGEPFNKNKLDYRVILDLKTGGTWSESQIHKLKLRKRFGAIPIIQIVIPIIGK